MKQTCRRAPPYDPHVARVATMGRVRVLKEATQLHDDVDLEFYLSNSFATSIRVRWKPIGIPSPIDFIDGLFTVCGAKSSFLLHDFAIHMYDHLLST
ncbi:hypothetical protein F8388_017426 [Cannabis sativa]|uniref:Homogentisate 1,2-dioxygenase N-terminal domain-containing protein n=1 Tax=Cannabis sativa TaxID=3483 RepID=A0A7J6EFW5_CANSA|nr:hypothetical protein F8388_017426 [Cannabis sativa]